MSSGHATVATEIDYILVSEHIGVAQKGVYPGVPTHMALVCTLTGMGCQPVTVQKRYKHRVTTEDQKQRAARLLALYWWWLAGTGPHLDAWVACYWSLADGILPPSSHQVSAQAILDRGKGLVNKGAACMAPGSATAPVCAWGAYERSGGEYGQYHVTHHAGHTAHDKSATSLPTTQVPRRSATGGAGSAAHCSKSVGVLS